MDGAENAWEVVNGTLGRHPQILTASARNFPYHQLAPKASLIIATMASKFMVNAAFEARLLLRPSHQRTVLFGTVNKLKYPIPGRPTLPPILSSRSYSDSTSTPPLPKTSGSIEGSQSSGPEDKTYSDSTPTPPFPKSSRPTKGSQSSGPEDKNWFSPETWDKTWAWAKFLGLSAGLGTISIVRAGSFLCAN
jgi:hypothetical protein